MLETPTWRANPDWGAGLGYDADALAAVNRRRSTFLRASATAGTDRVGTIAGQRPDRPRGDGYRPGAAVDPDEAAEYHRPQIAAFAEAGADLATALTLTDAGEALGVVAAARDVGIPVAISFTVETDGKLPTGQSLDGGDRRGRRRRRARLLPGQLRPPRPRRARPRHRRRPGASGSTASG